MRNSYLDRRRIQFGGTGNQWNTEIGGLDAVVTTDAELATLLGIQQSAITYFNASGGSVKAKIGVNYTIPNNCFNNSGIGADWGNGSVITRYKDPEGKVTSIGQAAFDSQTTFRENPVFPGVTYINQGGFRNTRFYQISLPELLDMYWFRVFDGNINLQMVHAPKLNTASQGTDFNQTFGYARNVYIPECLEIGTTHLDQKTFGNSPDGVNIWANSFHQTSNSGAEEGDLAYARNSKNANITYGTANGLLDKPAAINDLSIVNTYGTAFEMNFTEPISTNPILKYEVFVNGILSKSITNVNFTITNLNEANQYSISVISIDIYGNKSEQSNVVTDSTGLVVLPQNGLVSYFKLDGNANDSFGPNSGTNTNTTTVVGKLSNALYYSGNSYTNLGNNASLQLNTGTVAAWIKTPDAGTGFRGIVIKQHAIGLFLRDNELIYYSWESTAKTKATGIFVNDDEWHHVGLSFNNNGQGKLYLDGNLVLTSDFIIRDQVESMMIGVGNQDGNAQNFNGIIDEVPVYNRQLSDGEFSDLFKNGAGITYEAA